MLPRTGRIALRREGFSPGHGGHCAPVRVVIRTADMNFSKSSGAHRGSFRKQTEPESVSCPPGPRGQGGRRSSRLLALESRGQAPQQGRLSRRQPPAALLIPVRHPDATAIPAADRLDGVAKREHFDVAANGPLAHPQLCCQVWDSLLSPLAEQVQYQLSPLRRAHGLTPLSLPCPDSTG